ncbi:MAG: putative ral secretion pathway protein precursor [Herbaspirillum sp.]|nr:putative ral secretion pathway protein precursor [Herbaspirillum sp.]
MLRHPVQRSGQTIANRNRGFTLIEMVMVLALIGLLLSLAVPRYFTTIDNGKVKVQQQNLSSIRDALDKFFGDQGRYPETLDELVGKRYLRSVPVDPLTEKSNWTIVAPKDPEMGGVYDVLSSAEAHNDAK